MKAGDTVHDSITGDDLVLAWYDPEFDEAAWLGWPEGRLTEASKRLTVTAECSEAESLKLLRELAERPGDDMRARGARLELARWDAAHPFESADFYDCRESENLTCREPQEAIHDFFEVNYEPGDSICDLIDKHAPVVVEAYKTLPITPQQLRALAIQLREQVYDSLTEDFGDMDGDLPGLTAQVEAEIESGFNEVLTRVIAAHKVTSWRCEVVAKRSFDAEEIREMLGAYCPEWFEEEAAPPSGEVPA